MSDKQLRSEQIEDLATSKITSGTFADARISQSSVTQHEGAIDHGSIAGLADDDHTQYSIISSGAGAPGSTPSRVGAIYIDTTNDVVYIATGTASSADWDQATGAGGGDALTSNPLSQFASTTSAQLAGVISDETGSGALVFANSPTLVTPALGTPASGVLTNATGYPGDSSLTTVGTVTSGNVDAVVSAASTTTAGKVELATTTETNTGTDTGRAVTPDGLAGSYAGTGKVSVQLTDGSGAITTGDGKAYLRITESLDGMNLVGVSFTLTAPSTSGTPTMQIARGRQSSATTAHSFVNMLSTAVTIDENEYDSKDATTAAVINGSNDDVLIGDLIRFDMDGVGSGPTAVAIATLEFRLP